MSDKAIKLNYIKTRINAVVVLSVSKHFKWRVYSQPDKTLLTAHFGISMHTVHSWNQSQGHDLCHVTVSCAGCSIWNRKKPPLFSGYYLRNRSTFDIGVLGYISIL
jgi:hypothetical protein